MAHTAGSWTKETRALIKPTPRGPSKLTRTVRDTFLQVFNELQDEQKYPKANLLKVAQDDPALFYTLCSKLIPHEIQGSLKSVISVQIADPVEEPEEALVVESNFIIETYNQQENEQDS